MESLEDELVELADAYGVAVEYHDWRGEHVVVSRETVVAVLGALGVAAASPEDVSAALADRRLREWRRLLPPTVVVRAGSPATFPVHARYGEPVEAWVVLEAAGGGADDREGAPEVRRRDAFAQPRSVDPRAVDGELVGETPFALPSDLPPGYHRLYARSAGEEASAALIVSPARLAPAEWRGRRAWGLAAQLYGVRSRRSWGVGDLADLADLLAWSGREMGADFMLINPLHAAEPVPPMEPSPYLPTSRRFVNPLYLRVEDIPEFAYLDVAGTRRVAHLRAALARIGQSQDRIDRDAAWGAKREALELVHSVRRSPGRDCAYRAYVAQAGEGLRDFATWCALAERHGSDWTMWPEGLRDPRSAEVAAERAKLAHRVDFHQWLQWVLDEQLGTAQRAARDAGMALGVMHDLAVGVHPTGADAWGLQDVLAHGVTVGAPPDEFNQQGQDWSQPPWRPDRLEATGYAAFRDLVGTALRQAGALRVDHVMGLFRLWWVPAGNSADQGTYVRYDHEALVGILALEADRVGACVVGEDLGTVEPWVRDFLRDRGLLGTSILWFQRDGDGHPLRPEQWREDCLAAVTTHDLAPTAGYLAGEHVALRQRLGLLTRSVEDEMAADATARRDWLALLRELGFLDPDATGPEEQQLVEGLYRFLAATPSLLLAVSLADAVGDRRIHNQPGTSTEYPNWLLPLAGPAGEPVLLEDIVTSERVKSLGRAVSGR